MPQQAATLHQKLLPFGGQYEFAANLVEKPQLELSLEFGDLSRERRLRYPKVHGNFDDGALLRDGDKRSNTFEIHAAMYAEMARNPIANMHWTLIAQGCERHAKRQVPNE